VFLKIIVAVWSSVICILIGGGAVQAQVDFREQIAPLLERRSLGCHNAQRCEGDFSLHSAQTAFSADDIVPSDAQGGHLIDLITSEKGNEEKPIDADPLNDEEVRRISRF
jgi:hypothetical protein